MFVSLDLETVGENCGIIQISAEDFRLELSQVQGKATKDTMSPENIFLGQVAFGLTKTDARLPSYGQERRKKA